MIDNIKQQTGVMMENLEKLKANPHSEKSNFDAIKK
jgi:hypothetical protein